MCYFAYSSGLIPTLLIAMPLHHKNIFGNLPLPASDVFALGLMSGTSLDGLDIALVSFKAESGKLKHQLVKGTTIPYSKEWKRVLKELPDASAFKYVKTDHDLGKFMGQQTNLFLKELDPTLRNAVSFIGSHGHTVFHQPENGFTSQIGHPSHIAAITAITTVADFRTLDVALGGQGAPLVPIGDQILYSDYIACLNLGGIANISYQNLAGHRVAFDICAVNQVLNHLAARLNQDFDHNGDLARSGLMIHGLLNELNALPFYQTDKPKSLGQEWVRQEVLPLLDEETETTENLIHTYCHHVAEQIGLLVERQNLKGPILCTGGGTLNTFLIDLINRRISRQAWLHVPDVETIHYKEAMLFALLGYLRLNNFPNALRSVTGASRDNVGGAVYLG